MQPIMILFMGAGLGYLSGNPKARDATFAGLGKLSAMAIDALNKRGGNDVPTIPTPTEQAEQSED